MIADMLSNKKLAELILTELLIRSRKLNNFFVFITQLYFKVHKDVTLNTTHFLLWKFQIKGNFSKLHVIIPQILTLKTLWVFTENILQKPYCFLVIDATLVSINPSRFRKNLLKMI